DGRPTFLVAGAVAAGTADGVPDIEFVGAVGLVDQAEVVHGVAADAPRLGLQDLVLVLLPVEQSADLFAAVAFEDGVGLGVLVVGPPDGRFGQEHEVRCRGLLPLLGPVFGEGQGVAGGAFGGRGVSQVL